MKYKEEKPQMFGGVQQLDGEEHWKRFRGEDDEKPKTGKDPRKRKK